MVSKIKSFNQEMNCMLRFKGIREYYLCEDSDFNNMIDCFTLSTSIKERVSTDYFEILNSNFFLIRKNMFCKKKTKTLFKRLFEVRNEIEQKLGASEELSSEDLIIINNTCNILLIGCAESSTLYNIKRLVIDCLLKQLKVVQRIGELICEELKFIQMINRDNRKSSISWDYRVYLFKTATTNSNAHIRESIQANFEQSNSKQDNFEVNDNCELKKEEKQSLTDFIIYFEQSELRDFKEVNAKESRNYYLWKYILTKHNLIEELFEQEPQTIVLISKIHLSFALEILCSCPSDYSAFHYYYNLRLHITKGGLSKLFFSEELEKETIIKIEKSLAYHSYVSEEQISHCSTKHENYLNRLYIILTSTTKDSNADT